MEAVSKRSNDSRSLSNLALKFSSQTFENKSYEVKCESNAGGEVVVVREVDDDSQKSQIYIQCNSVNILLDALRNVTGAA